MANEMIKFFKGSVANLPATGVNGALYITNDEGAIYLGTGTGMKRLGDFVQVNNVASLPEKAHESCLYYCVAENILAKWNGTEWKQINKQPTAEELKGLLGLGTMAYKSEVAEGDLNAELKAKVNAAAEGNHSHDNKALLDTYTQTEANLADAVAKKHAHANADELAKIVDGDKAKWDAVVADHLTSADKTTLENSIKEAKQAGTDANTNVEAYKVTNDARVKAVEDDITEITDGTNGILAQAKAYADGKDGAIEAAKKAGDDAQDTIDAYIESNNAALDGVKATADAAAVKTEVETALAGKVDKVEGKSLISDAEITRLAGVTNYDDTQVKADIAKKADAETMTTELGKKVDKVDGFSLVSDTEIARLADVDNYDDEEVRGLIDDNAKAIEDLEGYVGTIPTNYTETNVIAYINKKAEETLSAAQGGSSETAASVKQQLDNYKGENDTRVKAAEDAIDAVEGRMDTAEGKIADLEAASATHAIKTEVEGALALKADKTALEATDKTLADVKATVDNFFAEDAAINDTIDTLKEIANYIATDKEGAADITARVGALEGKVDVDKVSEAIAAETSRATTAEGVLSGRIDVLEAIDHDAYVAADTALKNELNGEIAKKADSATMTTELDKKADKTQVATDIATAKSGAEAEAARLDGVLKTELQGAIDTKANAADVYAKTETFTKDEVNAAIAAAVETAHTWGEF